MNPTQGIELQTAPAGMPDNAGCVHAKVQRTRLNPLPVRGRWHVAVDKPRTMAWRAAGRLAATGAALALTACAVVFENLRPAQELAREALPPGSAYLGWRIYQERCAGCHGPAAMGTDKGPNLLPRMRETGPRQFVSLVLDRYDWNAPLDSAKQQASTREAAIEQVLQRKDAGLTMPEWADEPRVSAHIVDLYAYLSARSEGSLGIEKPSR